MSRAYPPVPPREWEYVEPRMAEWPWRVILALLCLEIVAMVGLAVLVLSKVVHS